MAYELLDNVVLEHDIPTHGLRKGDVGAIVELYEPDGVEVEFVAPGGKTRALLTLTEDDVRPMRESDVLAVRPLSHAG